MKFTRRHRTGTDVAATRWLAAILWCLLLPWQPAVEALHHHGTPVAAQAAASPRSAGHGDCGHWRPAVDAHAAHEGWQFERAGSPYHQPHACLNGHAAPLWQDDAPSAGLAPAAAFLADALAIDADSAAVDQPASRGPPSRS